MIFFKICYYFIFVFQARHISWGPSVIFASFCLVANLLVLTLPETGHRQLPQTVGDIRRWSDEEDDIWNSQYSPQIMRSFWTGNQHTETIHIENETGCAIVFFFLSFFLFLHHFKFCIIRPNLKFASATCHKLLF